MFVAWCFSLNKWRDQSKLNWKLCFYILVSAVHWSLYAAYAGEVIKEAYELEYGTDCLEMHVGAVQPGERALVIDDLIATGGTLSAAISLLGKWLLLIRLIHFLFLSFFLLIFLINLLHPKKNCFPRARGGWSGRMWMCYWVARG